MRYLVSFIRAQVIINKGMLGDAGVFLAESNLAPNLYCQNPEVIMDLSSPVAKASSILLKLAKVRSIWLNEHKAQSGGKT